MPDLLVKLYELDTRPAASAPSPAGVTIRPAMAYEKEQVVGWVRERFGRGWASECDVAFGNRPISCWIATEEGVILGFSCGEATCKGFFGPIGVAESARRRGIGRALLLSTLRGLADAGYAYAIIGAAGSLDFYRKTVGAIEIPDSVPGIYRDKLK